MIKALYLQWIHSHIRHNDIVPWEVALTPCQVVMEIKHAWKMYPHMKSWDVGVKRRLRGLNVMFSKQYVVWIKNIHRKYLTRPKNDEQLILLSVSNIHLPTHTHTHTLLDTRIHTYTHLSTSAYWGKKYKIFSSFHRNIILLCVQM